MTWGIRSIALLFVLSLPACFDAIALEPPELGLGGSAGDGRSPRGAGGYGGGEGGAAGTGGLAGQGGVAGLGTGGSSGGGGAAGAGGFAGAAGSAGAAGAAGAGGFAGAAGFAGQAGAAGAAGVGGVGGQAGGGGVGGIEGTTGPRSCAELCSSYLDWRIFELQCLATVLSFAAPPPTGEGRCQSIRDARGCERCLRALGASDRVCEAAALICGF